jgi:hypothetical protein
MNKYIRLKCGFVLFPSILIHKEVADQLDSHPLSAGTVEFLSNGEAKCLGGSDSLRLKSLSCDSDDLMVQLGILPPAKIRQAEMALVLGMGKYIDKYGRDVVGVLLREIAHNLLTRPTP